MSKNNRWHLQSPTTVLVQYKSCICYHSGRWQTTTSNIVCLISTTGTTWIWTPKDKHAYCEKNIIIIRFENRVTAWYRAKVDHVCNICKIDSYLTKEIRDHEKRNIFCFIMVFTIWMRSIIQNITMSKVSEKDKREPNSTVPISFFV